MAKTGYKLPDDAVEEVANEEKYREIMKMAL